LSAPLRPILFRSAIYITIGHSHKHSHHVHNKFRDDRQLKSRIVDSPAYISSIITVARKPFYCGSSVFDNRLIRFNSFRLVFEPASEPPRGHSESSLKILTRALPGPSFPCRWLSVPNFPLIPDRPPTGSTCN